MPLQVVQSTSNKSGLTLRDINLNGDHPQVLNPYRHMSPQILSEIMNMLLSGIRMRHSVSPGGNHPGSTTGINPVAQAACSDQPTMIHF